MRIVRLLSFTACGLAACGFGALGCAAILGFNDPTVRDGDANETGGRGPGSLDSDFGVGGVVEIPVESQGRLAPPSIVVDGQDIVVVSHDRACAGCGAIYIARCSRDGACDPNRQTRIPGGADQAIAIRAPGGNAVLLYALRPSAKPEHKLYRVTAEGNVETIFSEEPVFADAIDLVPRGTGSAAVYTEGASPAGPVSVHAFLADAGPDPSFGSRGVIRFETRSRDFALGGALAQDNGAVTVVGMASSDTVDIDKPHWVRFGPDGGRDRAFAPPEGEERDEVLNAVATDGQRYYVVGRTVIHEGLILRLAPDGQPDLGFGTAGAHVFESSGDEESSIQELRAVVVPAGGRVLALGYAEPIDTGNGYYVLVRMDSGGFLDPTFGKNGVVAGDRVRAADLSSHSLAVQDDGKILVSWVSGDNKLKIARHRP